MPGTQKTRIFAHFVLMLVVLVSWCAPAQAVDRSFTLYASAGYINLPDGAQVYMWGFSSDGTFRYPGPTLDVNAGDVVTVTVTNNLPVITNADGVGQVKAEPVSVVFFGQEGVTNRTPVYETVGDRSTLRSLAAEAAPGGSVVYTFTASRPGTYYYQSGTYPHKQIDMGLFGGLIVRPAACAALPCQAYGTADSAYDKEYLLMMSALDPIQHKRVEQGLPYLSSSWLPAFWFINGRSFPDTLAPDDADYLMPAQPMGALVDMYPGDRVLFRMVTLDRDVHPFHHHGNHARLIAHDGIPLKSSPTATTTDLAVERFTQDVYPGETQDAIFTWAGNTMNMGWDVTGTDPLRPVPVSVNPTTNNPDDSLIYGEFYSGSPYLGKQGELPSPHISYNSFGEHFMVFHSHHEYELQNDDESLGGLLTQIRIKPLSVP